MKPIQRILINVVAMVVGVFIIASLISHTRSATTAMVRQQEPEVRAERLRAMASQYTSEEFWFVHRRNNPLLLAEYNRTKDLSGEEGIMARVALKTKLSELRQNP